MNKPSQRTTEGAGPKFNRTYIFTAFVSRLLRVYTGAPTDLANFCGFPQQLQTGAEIKTDHDHFLPHLFDHSKFC